MTFQVTKISRARKNGIADPVLAWDAAQKAGVTFVVACALLEQESAGGQNVWGHDQTWMIGYPVMSADSYAVYKAHRSRFGNQGVGPCQLTSSDLQDQADALGGCYKPFPNMLVAFGLLKSWFDEGLTYHDAWVRYNGSQNYADIMDARITRWHSILNG